MALEPAADPVEYLLRRVPAGCTALALNAAVMERWLGHAAPEQLARLAGGRFTHLCVYGLRTRGFDGQLLAALSAGRVTAVQPAPEGETEYTVSSGAGRICGAFAGLRFGAVNAENDRVLVSRGNGSAPEALIAIGGRPLMATLSSGGTQLILIAGEQVADIDQSLDCARLPDQFSRFMPHAMALRAMAGEAAWRPSGAFAALIVDDPALAMRYGFLDFEKLVRMADEHGFHTAIGFIPYNYRKVSARTAGLFRDHAARLSVCLHGNDHTFREFAFTDRAFLHTQVRTALNRIAALEQRTGIYCDRVMLPPQGRFSAAAMRVLKVHNFLAAVNSPTLPVEDLAPYSLRDYMQPAVLRFGGFPIFLRESIRKTRPFTIAFNLFFGRAILFGEHHDIFSRSGELVEMVRLVNAMAPGIRWTGVGEIARSSYLTRISPEGVREVRAFARTVRVADDACGRPTTVEWSGFGDGAFLRHVLIDGAPAEFASVNTDGARIAVDLPRGRPSSCSLDYECDRTESMTLGFGWRARVLARRSLSEFRDNYLSRNQMVLLAAKRLQKMLLPL